MCVAQETAEGLCSGMVALSNEVEVWIVRHGERVDEAPGNKWVKCGKGNPNWFDPPLTERGHHHATLVADSFRETFSAERSFDVIFTSPLVRTVQSAEKFSAVHPHPSFSFATWSKRTVAACYVAEDTMPRLSAIHELSIDVECSEC